MKTDFLRLVGAVALSAALTALAIRINRRDTTA